jgi:hypothetical protein
MLERLLLVMLVAGCGGPPPQPIPKSNTAPKQTVPAPLYAGMFVEGAKLRYELVGHSSRADDQDPNADAHGNVNEHDRQIMTCTVGKVERLQDAVAAPLECDVDIGVPVGGAGPSGVYVATAAGLWRFGSIEEVKLEALTAETAILPAAPSERQSGSEQSGVVRRLTRGAGDSWCASHTYSGGDEAGTRLCFARGVLVSGYAYWAGGSSREVEYVLQ